VKCLCRLVWSEHTHARRETAAARRAEASFLREQEVHGALRHAAPSRGDPERRPQEAIAASYEDQVVGLETEREEDARRAKRLAEMRADLATLRDGFESKKDH
jgi:hypothetical protein